MKKTFLALAILMLGGAQPASAQLLIPNSSYLESRLLPRAHALGDATVALRGYAGAAQINPATIGRAGFVQGGSYVQGGGTPLPTTPWPLAKNVFSDPTEYWVAEPSISYKRGRWAGAYQYRRINLGRHESRNENNEITGTYTSYDASHHIAAAYDFSRSFSVGAGLEYLRSDLGEGQMNGEELSPATSLALDLGLYYEHPSLAWSAFQITPSAGWALRHFGGKMDYIEGDDIEGDPLPITMQAGVSVQARTNVELLDRPLFRLGVHGNISKLFVGGERKEDGSFSTYGPFEALQKTWGSYEVDIRPNDGMPGTTVNAWQRLTRSTGVELSVLDIVSLRLGKLWRHKFNQGSQTTMGFGLDLYYVALNHSTVRSAENDRWRDASFWTLTARVPLGSEAHPENFWPELIDAVADVIR